MKITNRKLGALAKMSIMVGACAVPCLAAAQSESVSQTQPGVKVYGLVDMYMGSVKRSDQNAATTSANGGGTYTSYWAISGVEDLGGSYRALFVLESFFQPDTGATGRNATDPFMSKNSFVGLSGPFGEITAGRYTIPLLKATAAANPFGASLQLSPLMLQTWIPNYGRDVVGDSVWNNAVRYVTPESGGLQGTVLMSLGEDPNTNGKNNRSLSLNYRTGGLSATLLNQSAKTGPGFPTGVTEQSTWMGGATYDFKSFKLYGTYYKTKTTGLDVSDKTGQVGISIPVGVAGKISASWANSVITTRGRPTVMRNDFAGGYEYALSRRTALYGIYLMDKLSDHGSAGTLALGIRHTF